MEQLKLLPIRIKRLEGESLTSFLMRIATENYMSCSDLLHLVRNDKLRQVQHPQQIDFGYFDLIVPEKLKIVTNLTDSDLENLTFLPIKRRFLGNNQHQLGVFLTSQIEVNKRKYCPLCLVKKHYFKLIWQVKNVEMCDIHNVILESACVHCSRDIPIIFDEVVKGSCPFCKATFYCHKLKQSVITQQQKRILINWSYLLNDKSLIINRFSYDYKDLATTLLYLAQNKEELFSRKRVSLHIYYTGPLLKFATDEVTDRRILLKTILDILEKIQVDIPTLYLTYAPIIYVNSIKEVINKTMEIQNRNCGPCLAPWCESFSSNRNMKRLNYVTSRFKFKNKILSCLHICSCCSLKYGYNDNTDKWEECEDFISFGWGELLQLINKDIPFKEIKERYNINYSKLMNYVQYLARHCLLEMKILKRHVPQNLIEYPLIYFQQLIGSMFNNAHKLFGWTEKEFLYYYYSPEVQEWLYVETVRTTTQSIQNKKLLLENVKREKEEERIQQFNAQKVNSWSITKEYLLFCEQTNSGVNLEEFYHRVGRGFQWLEKHMPDLCVWFVLEKNKLNDSLDKKKKEKLKRQLIIALCILFNEGGRPSLYNIAIKAGIDPSSLYYQNQLLNCVKETRDKINSGEINTQQLLFEADA